MKKSADKKVNDQKLTNNLVKFWVIGGIAVLSLGAIAATALGISRAVIAAQKSKIYTVSFDITGSNPKGARLDDAKGLVAGINGEKNDFDNVYPYKGIKEVKDERGDVYVRIPKFYQRIDIKDESMTFSVSSSAHKGFTVAPAFMKGKEEIPYIDIGKYEASVKDGSLVSKSGLMPEVTGHTLDEYRTLAEKDGNQLFDFRHHEALQMLYLVEFANLDSQAVMSGETQYLACYHEFTADEIERGEMDTFSVYEDEVMCIDTEVDHEKFAKANLSHVDISMYHDANVEVPGDKEFSIAETVSAASFEVESGEISKIKLSSPVDVSKMSEGEGISIAFGSYNYHKTGSSDGRKGSSNGSALKDLEVTSMNYRGIENWYSNSYSWVDGIATFEDENENSFICISMDASKNSDRSSYKRYASQDEMLKDGNFMAEFSMTDEIEYQYDYYSVGYSSENYLIGFVGGSYDLGSYAGAFYLNLSSDVSNASYSVRLSCLPQ